MALIPGTLPNDTCYGTPQDLLELFAQYLDVPAFALNSKVVFSTSSVGLTADVVWFDTTAPTNPILKITVSGGFVDYVKNYITAAPVVTIVGADTVLILDASDSGNTKRGLVSDIVPAAGSVTFPMLSTSATEANNVEKRVAKAWVNFNGTGTVAIRDDFNVSTVADNGTGTYTINFSTNLSNALYCVNASAARNIANESAICGPAGNAGTYSTAAVQIRVQGDSGVAEDSPIVGVSIFN